MTKQGWVRLQPTYSGEAVVWWFVKEFDDGFVYARGGRVRSARAARRELREHRSMAHREHHYYMRRPTHELGEQGELIPLDLPSSGLGR